MTGSIYQHKQRTADFYIHQITLITQRDSLDNSTRQFPPRIMTLSPNCCHHTL